jgi:hypothetical protein
MNATNNGYVVMGKVTLSRTGGTCWTRLVRTETRDEADEIADAMRAEGRAVRVEGYAGQE